MSRLVDRVPSSDRRPEMHIMAGGENGDHLPSGIMLGDGTAYQLQGQPPLAVSHGWGKLAWLGTPR